MKKQDKFEKLYTPFGESLNKECPLPEYPRPQFARDSFLNLNGYWDYAILKKGKILDKYQGKILVPFSPESLLSEVSKIVMPDDVLYYNKSFNVPSAFIKEKSFLNFGAVDYICNVYLNDTFLGKHIGGFFPFSFDVSNILKEGMNTLKLDVTDPSDTGVQARGKQKIKRGGIFYTPQSGIWQTVWIESVPMDYVYSLKTTPDIDNSTVEIVLEATNVVNCKISVFDDGKEIASGSPNSDGKCILDIPNSKLWSPESPTLYDIEVTIGKDKVSSYFGMRKFGLIIDNSGIERLMLNNEPYFHNGLLDQGYWPDGLYTAPSDEALIFDIQKMKDLGFNMLRKHIKIEPLRWYYHCDKIGMLVWQDFINGGKDANKLFNGFLGLVNLRSDDTKYLLGGRQDKMGRDEFYIDAKRTIDLLYNTVSLSVWVPFNESWGQFDSVKVYDFVKKLDNTRPIDHASGWVDQGYGDFKSLHIYFVPITIPKKEKRCIILSEFGGYSLKIDGHIFNNEKSFGYRAYSTKEGLEEAYLSLFNTRILPLIPEGLSATVYTQLSDVEDEINGIYTYDRKVLKLNAEKLLELNKRIKL